MKASLVHDNQKQKSCSQILFVIGDGNNASDTRVLISKTLTTVTCAIHTFCFVFLYASGVLP